MTLLKLKPAHLLMANNKKGARLSKVQDPIELELTQVAREKLPGIRMSDQLDDDDESNMFIYAGADDSSDDAENRNGNDQYVSDRFKEESVIDILANVDNELIEENMVTHQEDDLIKTIAGVAGNVLEW